MPVPGTTTTGLTRLLTLAAVMIALVVVNAALFAATTTTAAAVEIKFGTLLPLAVVPPSQLVKQTRHLVDSQYQFFSGMRAAFEDANEQQIFGPDVNVSLVVKAIDVNFGVGIPEAVELVTVDKVIALLGASYYASPAVFPYFALPNNVPYIAGLAADISTLTANRSAVNYRYSFDVETFAWINYALNSKISCTKFAFYYYGADPGVTKLAENGKAALLSLEVESVLMVSNNPPPDDFNTTPFLTLLDDAAKRPQCIFMLVSAEFLPTHLRDYTSDPRYDRANTYFFASSVANLPTLQAASPLTYENLHLTQQLPNPFDATSSKLVGAYHRALARTVARNATPPNGTYGTIDATPSYFSLEGYTVGRLAMEMLINTRRNYTSAAMLDSLYSSNFIRFEDIVLGPYVDHCEAGLTALGMPCFCNAGNKLNYITKVNPQKNVLEQLQDDAMYGEKNVAKTVTSIDKCTTTASISIPRPVSFILGQGVEGRANTAAESFFVEALRVFTILGNSYGVNPGYEAWIRMLPHNYTSSTSIASQLQQLAGRHKVVGYMGLGVSPEDVHDANQSIVAMQFSETLDDKDPPLSEWRRAKIGFDPVLADHVHALVSYLSEKKDDNNADAGIDTIVLFADTEERKEMAIKSLNTYQLLPSITRVLTATLENIARAAMLHQLTEVITSNQQNRTWVLVVSQNVSIIQAAVSLATDAATRDITFLLATNEESIYATLTHPQVTSTPSFRAFFASGFKPFWHPTHQLYNFINSVYPSISYASPQMLKAFKYAAIIIDASSGMHTGISASNFIDRFFAQSISVADILLSPLMGQVCDSADIATLTAERNCQCSKGTFKFHIHQLSDWANKRATPSSGKFEYTLSPCGVIYKPLKSTTSYSTIIAALGGSFAGLMLLVICGAIYVYRLPARDNHLAPKDPNKPFTICFTDIQSSTSLWSRAPQEMSKAVEDHHREIRKLVKKWKGYEVKTIGDSFMCAFNEPINALKFSIGIQRALFEFDWETQAIDKIYKELEREKLEEKDPEYGISIDFPTYDVSVWNGLRVRVGIHFGLGNPQLDPTTLGYDYYGTVVNTAARVEGVGHGGQVLFTDEMYKELTSMGCKWDAGTLEVTDLGPQPLRGLSEPVTLYQVVPKELGGRAFGPLRLDVEMIMENEEEEAGMMEGVDAVSTRSSNASSIQSKGGVEIDVNEEMGKFGVSKKCEVLFEQYAKICKTMDFATAMTTTINHHSFIYAMYATMPSKDRLESLQNIAAKWHVHLPRHFKVKKGKTEQDKSYNDQLFRYLLTRVVVRVAPTHEHTKEGFMRRMSSRALLSVGRQVTSPMGASGRSSNDPSPNRNAGQKHHVPHSLEYVQSKQTSQYSVEEEHHDEEKPDEESAMSPLMTNPSAFAEGNEGNGKDVEERK